MHAFAHDQLPRAVAIWGAAGAVAGALGPTLGAAIVEGLGWRWAFFINLPVGIYTVIAGRRSLHESSDPNTQVPSLVGVVLIAAAAGLLSYSLVGTDDYGWLSVRTLGMLITGLVVLAVFIVHQQHTKAPALDLDLFRIGNFRWANLAMLLFGTAFAALFFGSILFLTDVWDWSVLQAGFGVAPGPVVVGLVAPRAGKLAGRIGQRPLHTPPRLQLSPGSRARTPHPGTAVRQETPGDRDGQGIRALPCAAAAVAVVLSATVRKKLCVVARRAQRAQVMNERAKVVEAAALDPQRTVPAPWVRNRTSSTAQVPIRNRLRALCTTTSCDGSPPASRISTSSPAPIAAPSRCCDPAIPIRSSTSRRRSGPAGNDASNSVRHRSNPSTVRSCNVFSFSEFSRWRTLRLISSERVSM